MQAILFTTIVEYTASSNVYIFLLYNYQIDYTCFSVEDNKRKVSKLLFSCRFNILYILFWEKTFINCDNLCLIPICVCGK